MLHIMLFRGSPFCGCLTLVLFFQCLNRCPSRRESLDMSVKNFIHLPWFARNTYIFLSTKRGFLRLMSSGGAFAGRLFHWTAGWVVCFCLAGFRRRTRIFGVWSFPLPGTVLHRIRVLVSVLPQVPRYSLKSVWAVAIDVQGRSRVSPLIGAGSAIVLGHRVPGHRLPVHPARERSLLPGVEVPRLLELQLALPVLLL